MKILVDEMPLFQQDCPFYTGYNCSIDNTKCEYLHLFINERCTKTECKWLKEESTNASD